jgi:hypothetical protein
MCKCKNRIILTSLTDTLPLRAVPVITVPWPLILKQWSTEKINGPFTSRWGIYVFVLSVPIRSCRPKLSVSDDFNDIKINYMYIQITVTNVINIQSMMKYWLDKMLFFHMPCYQRNPVSYYEETLEYVCISSVKFSVTLILNDYIDDIDRNFP